MCFYIWKYIFYFLYKVQPMIWSSYFPKITRGCCTSATCVYCVDAHGNSIRSTFRNIQVQLYKGYFVNSHED